MAANRKYVRRKILDNLKKYGLKWNKHEGKFVAPNFRLTQKKLAKNTNPDQAEYEERAAPFIARSQDVDILSINPQLVPVDQSNLHRDLWAYASSFWSIPVTTGYGRRFRYFVFDQQNEKLIGIVGLADPIIGLGIRDVASINWSREEKQERLYNCMTAYILGAIPPYNKVLGGKLVALTIMFPELRKWFYTKYKDSKTIIEKRKKKPHLLYVDTLGAFGKSSIYNRLLNWDFVGYTKGQSHIHITANGSWELIRKVLTKKEFKTYKFGQGPNWKMRVLRIGLQKLGLSEEMMSIGWQRGYYRCTLAENWAEYLRGESQRVKWKTFSQDDLVKYWKNRWVTPRLDNLQEKLLSE